MSGSAWVYQDDKQVKKHGKLKASYYVGWLDETGRRRCKSCGPGAIGKKNAEQLRNRIEKELFAVKVLNVAPIRKPHTSWADFTEKLNEKYYPQLGLVHLSLVKFAMAKFESLVGPKYINLVTTEDIDSFISKRVKERVRNTKKLVSEAEVNKELRGIKLVMSKAKEWKLLDDLPVFRFLREPEKLKRYVLPEHFQMIYDSCCVTFRPNLQGIDNGDWWRAILVMAFMTGWRISELLALKWDDVDFENLTCITRHEDNKGKRDEKVSLHPVVMEHLRRIRGFTEEVFHWKNNNKALYRQFYLIQEHAGILKCGHKGAKGKHEHTAECGAYVFHDVRRAFATENADRLTEVTLQRLMRHKSFSTTQEYINQAKRMKPLAEEGLYVPPILQRREAK